MLKNFSVPSRDSVRTEFGYSQQAGFRKVSIRKGASPFLYSLLVDGLAVGVIHGKEVVVGGDGYAFVPDYNQDDEIRLDNLHGLIYYLSDGVSVQEAVRELLAHELELEWWPA